MGDVCQNSCERQFGTPARFPRAYSIIDQRVILTPLAPCEIIEINDLMELRMAGNLHVRNLDDNLIARLKRRAARHGRSTEAEHREILRQALAGDVEPSFDTLAAELRKLTRRRKQTPSEVLLRKGREER
jgi:plasmid stability protein